MALVTLSSILELFADEISVVKKAENCLDSGHVIEVVFDGTLNVIRGKVLASMKKRSYQVEINLDRDGSIQMENINCQCARGQFKCHHIAAILLYSNKNFSKTDKICQWKAPSSSGPEQSASVKDLFPKPQHCSTNRSVDAADKEFFYNQLKLLNRFSGFCWLLSPEQETLHADVQSFSKILDLSKTDTGEIDEKLLFTNFQVTEKEIVHVAATTCGQNENPTWHQMRLGRLTASNFGIVLNACTRDRYSPSLYSQLLGKTNLSGVKAIQWGLTHEETALKEFEDNTKKQVVKTGLWLHECGFLGASPDGLVGEDSIVEVKCPFSHRNSTIEELKNDKKYCLDENLCLRQSHVYFHQIQGLLHITKRSVCHFVVWTPTLYIQVDVLQDLDWLPNLEILKQFYKTKLLKKLLE